MQELSVSPGIENGIILPDAMAAGWQIAIGCAPLPHALLKIERPRDRNERKEQDRDNKKRHGVVSRPSYLVVRVARYGGDECGGSFLEGAAAARGGC